MLRKSFIALAVLGLLLVAVPAGAIVDPTDDDGDHPQVGQLLFWVPDDIDDRFEPDDPGGWFSCSGTVIEDRVVLTAGHCTWGVGNDGTSTTRSADTTGDGTINLLDDVDLDGDGGNDVWFTLQDVVDYSFLPHWDATEMCSTCWYVENSTNAQRYAEWKAALNSNSDWTRGVAHPHPDYEDAAFFLHDAGIVEFSSSLGVSSGDLGQLPDEGHLDQYLAKRRNTHRFTPVGYGLQSGFPLFEGGDTRYQASVMLVDATGGAGVNALLAGTAVMFSNNSGRSHKGGTCYGDSGGPVFDGDTALIVAITSFGLSPACRGVDGGYRIDQADDLAFIEGYL